MIHFVRNYYKLAVLCAFAFILWLTTGVIQMNGLQSLDLAFFMRGIVAMIGMTLLMLPTVAAIDFLIVRSIRAVFNDFKNADSTGKILIVAVVLLFISRKILLYL